MLAEKLCMTVADLRRRMTTQEFAQWIAFNRYRDGLKDQAIEKERLKANARLKAHGHRPKGS